MRGLRVRIRLLQRRRRRIVRALRATFARLVARIRALSARAIRAGVVLGVIAGLSLAAGALAATLYGQFGYHPGRNADAWASLTPQFVGPASCASCHAAQAARWTAGSHAGVSCESCHGPMAGHPEATPSPLEPAPTWSAEPGESIAPVPLLSLDERSTVGLPESGPTALCLTCHRAATGRPASFPTVDPTTHYAGPDCIVCHDPHSAVAPQPPQILHPLAGMPNCTLCHSPTGMRPLPPAHPSWTGSCLTCHRSTKP